MCVRLCVFGVRECFLYNNKEGPSYVYLKDNLALMLFGYLDVCIFFAVWFFVLLLLLRRRGDVCALKGSPAANPPHKKYYFGQNRFPSTPN